MFHYLDDIVSSLWSELFARCIRYTEHIACILDRHDLGSEANPQIWNPILSRISSGLDHPLRSTSSESSWYTDTIEIIEDCSSSFLYFFCVDEPDPNSFSQRESCTFESLIEGVVGVFEIDIFADHTNTEHIERSIDIVHEFYPFLHIWFYYRHIEFL